jgi:glucose-1-phosphate cytidylyltransferase
MVEVGGLPILVHIMKIYAAYGYREFVVALGYKGEAIKNHFLGYYYVRSDLRICLGSGKVEVRALRADDWVVDLVDTGLRTQTGGRIKQLAPWIGDGTFMLTYGDGVADVDIREIVAFHKAHGRLATVTAVRPPARFGELVLDGDRVARFTEKPQVGEGWVNGGFFVLEREVLDYIDGDDTAWEREPLERLAKEGQVVAYKHEKFWQCVDTLRDLRLLEAMWESAQAPWKVWED